MSARAKLQPGPTGTVPAEEGWFVLNARDARWEHAPGRSAICDFEGPVQFEQIGVNLSSLEPGEAMSRYHWEADQEDFLVLAGEALLIVEGDEHPLKAWDFVHCPPKVGHVIVGAGHRRCLVLAVGARERQDAEDCLAYPVDAAALRHHAGVEHETADASVAYADLPARKPTTFDPSWLPE
jgi:uncharacterized cupin superfamily protein